MSLCPSILYSSAAVVYLMDISLSLSLSLSLSRDGSGRCEQLAKKVQEKLDEFKAGKRDLGQVSIGWVWFKHFMTFVSFFLLPGIQANIGIDNFGKVFCQNATAVFVSLWMCVNACVNACVHMCQILLS